MPSRSDVVVFLGGAPGTGKSTVAGVLAERVPGLVILHAGELIHRGLRDIGEYDRPAVADHDQARLFQDLLVSQFAAMRQRFPGPVVLDGHFAVPTGAGPAEIPTGVFERLGCTHLVILERPTDEVAARLRKRGGAKWWDGTDEALGRLAVAERTNAERVAAVVALPMFGARNLDAVVAYVQQLLAECQ